MRSLPLFLGVIACAPPPTVIIDPVSVPTEEAGGEAFPASDCEFFLADNMLRVEIISEYRRGVVPGLVSPFTLRFTAAYRECGGMLIGHGLTLDVFGAPNEQDTSWISAMATSGIVATDNDQIVIWDTGASLDANTWYPWLDEVFVPAGETVELTYWIDTSGARPGQAIVPGLDRVSVLTDSGPVELSYGSDSYGEAMVFTSDQGH